MCKMVPRLARAESTSCHLATHIVSAFLRLFLLLPGLVDSCQCMVCHLLTLPHLKIHSGEKSQRRKVKKICTQWRKVKHSPPLPHTVEKIQTKYTVEKRRVHGSPPPHSAKLSQSQGMLSKAPSQPHMYLVMMTYLVMLTRCFFVLVQQQVNEKHLCEFIRNRKHCHLSTSWVLDALCATMVP